MLEIAKAKSSPLNELNFVVNTFNHTTGCVLVKVIGNLISPTG